MPINGARKYLRRHKSTRSIVERSIGKLKTKFPCLQHLRLKSPELCCQVIMACVVLYNMNNIHFNLSTNGMNLEYYEQNVHQDPEDVLAQVIGRFENEDEDE